MLLFCGSVGAQPLRLGQVSYEDTPPSSEARGPSGWQLQCAAGSYAELAYWWQQGWLDLAVVTPGLLRGLPVKSWVYLGSEDARAQQGSLLLVRKDAGLKSWQQLRDLPQLEVMAVDPASVSGYLYPMHCLRQSGIHPDPQRVRFTHSHSNVIRALATRSEPALGLCWEGSWKANPHPDLQVLDLPALGQHQVPGMALIARPDLERLEELRSSLKNGSWPHFRPDPHYLKQVAELPPPPAAEQRAEASRERVDLDDLVWTLHHYNRTHPQPARLGVVLSGGGAKCSFQAGAVRALEERLAEARVRLKDDQLQIQLVVGTSGGAINAVAVALGLTSSAEGFEQLRKAWGDLDQRELVRPPLAVRCNMWLWFASIGLLVAAGLQGLFRLSSSSTHRLTLVLGLGLAGLVHLPGKPWSWLGTDSNLQHFYTWLSRGLEGAGWILVLAALWGHRRRRRLPLLLAIAGVTLLPLIQTWNILFIQQVVSENHGLEQALRRNFGRLIDVRCGQPVRTVPPAIGQLSREVLDKKLLVRDLALAASPLTDPELQLPAEYYFFSNVLGRDPRFFKERGVSLAQRPELLFDAVLGSAAIYPLFPSRRVHDLPQPGRSVDLVDGSFAHRSPLEAAVLWEATHVLVVEASTSEVSRRGHLLANLGASLNFLYDEAQLVDVRQRDRVALYTLVPEAPHIGLLDFSENLIQASIDKGYREAQSGFQKRLGPPRFTPQPGSATSR